MKPRHPRVRLGILLVLLVAAPAVRAGDDAPLPFDVAVPRVGTLGLVPEGAGVIVVHATGDGRIYVGDQGPLGLVGLRGVLHRLTADPRWREPDRCSRLSLVIHADASLPWVVPQWILQTAAEPQVLLYKIFVGARPRDGDAVGAIGLRLPKDRYPQPSPGQPVVKVHRATVKLYSNEVPASDPEALFPLLAAMRNALEEPAAAIFEIEAPMPTGAAVPTGFVVQVMDVARRAGFDRVELGGAPAPMGPGRRDAAWLQRHVAELQKRAGTPTIRFGGQTVPGALGEGESAPPALGRVPRAYGFGIDETGRFRRSWDRALEEDLEEEVLEGEDLEGVEEPVIKDEEVDARRTAAIGDALKWLAAHQSPNGGWEAAGFGRWCDGKPATNRADGAGKAHYDAGVTGLALSAFLRAGYTNRGKHPFARTVSKSLRYLKNVQDPEGCFGPRANQHYIYNHAIASLAVIEAYGRTGSPVVLGTAQRALDFIARSRNPCFAWRYGVRPGDNDTSVTGWMTMALVRAKRINEDAEAAGKPAPLRLDEEAFEGIRAWIEKMTDEEHGRTGYIQRGMSPARPQELIGKFPGDKSESLTAVGMLARVLLGEDSESVIVRKGAKLLSRLPPRWNPADGSIDMYYWYYGTLAMQQVGGDLDRAWRGRLLAALLENQRMDSTYCQYRGSWDPIGPWGPDGGRVYATALMAMCL